MKQNKTYLLEETALMELLNARDESTWIPSANAWVKILRDYLRMTQTELAERAAIPQSHVVRIEKGRGDIQMGTLKKVFEALSCDFIVKPKPQKPLKDILRGRAQKMALQRLQQSMGSMALEGQAPNKKIFEQLLNKKTDEILNDPREKLWRDGNDQ